MCLGLAPLWLSAETGFRGAGSTAIQPLLEPWGVLFEKASGLALDYQGVGSGRGLELIRSNAVQFGASDMPLKADDPDRHRLLQLPLALCGIVPAYHLDPAPAKPVVLSGPVLADILLGRIRSWDDPALRALNPGLRLPHQDIHVVTRSDASGTTFNLSDYLCKVSPAWKESLGLGSRPAWPVGVSRSGNAGVADALSATSGSLGYLEYSFAVDRGLSMADMVNHDGHVVGAGLASFQGAATGTDHGDNLLLTMAGERQVGAWVQNGESLVNQPGPEAWPIAATTWMILRTDQPSGAGAATPAFFRWILDSPEAGELARRKGYVPLDPVSGEAARSLLTREFGAK
jgi:phosphate transport system substrate-binding protein